jgi:hypothetical protein
MTECSWRGDGLGFGDSDSGGAERDGGGQGRCSTKCARGGGLVEAVVVRRGTLHK